MGRLEVMFNHSSLSWYIVISKQYSVYLRVKSCTPYYINVPLEVVVIIRIHYCMEKGHKRSRQHRTVTLHWTVWSCWFNSRSGNTNQTYMILQHYYKIMYHSWVHNHNCTCPYAWLGLVEICCCLSGPYASLDFVSIAAPSLPVDAIFSTFSYIGTGFCDWCWDWGLFRSLVMRWWRSAPSRTPTVKESTMHGTPVMAATAALLRGSSWQVLLGSEQSVVNTLYRVSRSVYISTLHCIYLEGVVGTWPLTHLVPTQSLMCTLQLSLPPVSVLCHSGRWPLTPYWHLWSHSHYHSLAH